MTLLLAGILTILLPCVLPLVPIVLGVSIADRDRRRPAVTICGMLVSFVGFTFLLQVVLSRFIELADILRIATYYVLLLFGFGFLFSSLPIQIPGAIAGSFFFLGKGWTAVMIAAVAGCIAVVFAGKIVTRIQQLGTDIQGQARTSLGSSSLLSAFIVGLTMGLVWVPCAGPALGFALALVRDEPGLRAFFLLGAYGIGAALPLLLIGYGGQRAVHSVRALAPYTGRIKQVSGALLIFSAIAFQFGWFTDLQAWLVEETRFGTVGTDIEERLFEKGTEGAEGTEGTDVRNNYTSVPSATSVPSSSLPILAPAPEISGLGPWHNSPPFTLRDLRGKVVLVDFWTYSCINCIRTLPYLKEYWEKYKDTGKFVLLGVHSPEFIFEKSESNVAAAVRKYGLAYPVAQDNDFATWRAFENRYWPAKYLIDAEGNVRYTHFGEGEYEETDRAIASLLQEIDVDRGNRESDFGNRVEDHGRDRTPEIYLGSRSWTALANRQGSPSDAVLTYQAPSSLQLHQYALGGDWQLVDEERQVLRGETGEIRIRFLGSEINLVLGSESGNPVTADVEIDGNIIRSFLIDRQDLYTLYKGEYGEHTLIVKLKGKGVEGYAFTFGGVMSKILDKLKKYVILPPFFSLSLCRRSGRRLPMRSSCLASRCSS